LGHSTGGTAAIFSIMHYDLEVDLALKKVEKQIKIRKKFLIVFSQQPVFLIIK